MFGKRHERIAYEFLKADVYQQEPLRKELLRIDPIKSTIFLVIGGAVVLDEFGKANLTAPYRKVPEEIFYKALAFHEKTVSDVANFVEMVGDKAWLLVCDALTASEEQIAIFAGFVLLYRSGYSYDVMQKLDTSLHHLSNALSDQIRTLIASMIIIIQAHEGYGQASSILQEQAIRMGYDVEYIADSIMAEAMNYSLPYKINITKPTQANSEENNDMVAKWTHHWYWVDPDNAPWNND